MNTTPLNGLILLFYKYVPITDPVAIQQWLVSLCQQLDLKGRIIVAQEGINATVGGTVTACVQFKETLSAHPLFGNIDFKESPGSALHFPRLRVTVRTEIVTLGIAPETLSAQEGGTHLTPTQVHELLAQRSAELVVLDARNRYESRIGAFEGAIAADIENFRDFPAYINQNLEQFKDKTVVMYCTGGIRCERASAYLKQTGVTKEVYQLSGGIHRYVEQYPDGFFKGKNYVFDGRIALPVSNDILSACEWCRTACDEYTNCVNTQCNKKVISCNACTQEHYNTCGDRCKSLVATRQVKIRVKPARITPSPSR